MTSPHQLSNAALTQRDLDLLFVTWRTGWTGIWSTSLTPPDVGLFPRIIVVCVLRLLIERVIATVPAARSSQRTIFGFLRFPQRADGDGLKVIAQDDDHCCSPRRRRVPPLTNGAWGIRQELRDVLGSILVYILLCLARRSGNDDDKTSKMLLRISSEKKRTGSF